MPAVKKLGALLKRNMREQKIQQSAEQVSVYTAELLKLKDTIVDKIMNGNADVWIEATAGAQSEALKDYSESPKRYREFQKWLRSQGLDLDVQLTPVDGEELTANAKVKLYVPEKRKAVAAPDPAPGM